MKSVVVNWTSVRRNQKQTFYLSTTTTNTNKQQTTNNNQLSQQNKWQQTMKQTRLRTDFLPQSWPKFSCWCCVSPCPVFADYDTCYLFLHQRKMLELTSILFFFLLFFYYFSNNSLQIFIEGFLFFLSKKKKFL